MQQQDETFDTGKTIDQAENDVSAGKLTLPTTRRTQIGEKDFDWLALGVVLIIAALFALAARFNAQPATSLAPVSVLSATGCGLLITGIRKIRTPLRPGLREAALGGLFLAVFQFIAALSYPHVVQILGQVYDERLGFLTTWGLITAFSIVFSMIGATLGHMAFAPLRPLPVKKAKLDNAEEQVSIETDVAETRELDNNDLSTSHPATSTRQRTVVNLSIAVLLLGLAPTMVGYMFSAAFDYMLSAYQFFPGPYPTLRLLSTLLPWQIPVAIAINGSDTNSLVFFLWQLWRFPVLIGNPTMFDVQALEPFVFNSAALAILLLTMQNPQTDSAKKPWFLGWTFYLFLEFLLGLLLVLPAALWIMRGLEGLLQDPVIAIPIRTLTILDSRTFFFNLITGPLLCLGIGVLLRFSRRKGMPQRPQEK